MRAPRIEWAFSIAALTWQLVVFCKLSFFSVQPGAKKLSTFSVQLFFGCFEGVEKSRKTTGFLTGVDTFLSNW
jgi:hypothetical protein